MINHTQFQKLQVLLHVVQTNFNANLEIVYTLIIPIAMVHVFKAIGEMMALKIVLMAQMKKIWIMIISMMMIMLMMPMLILLILCPNLALMS